VTETQLPGVFGDLQPVLQHYGYLAVGGFVLLEDFGVPVPGEGYMNRHGGKIVAAARFIEGLRQLNGFLAGMVGMHWAKFLAYNALGAVLWVCTWSAFGYFAGKNIDEIYAAVEHYKWYVIGALAIVAAVVVAVRVRRRRTAETA
jgi:membrane protein DedA with SNARE-associated domain